MAKDVDYYAKKVYALNEDIDYSVIFIAKLALFSLLWFWIPLGLLVGYSMWTPETESLGGLFTVAELGVGLGLVVQGCRWKGSDFIGYLVLLAVGWGMLFSLVKVIQRLIQA